MVKDERSWVGATRGNSAHSIDCCQWAGISRAQCQRAGDVQLTELLMTDHLLIGQSREKCRCLATPEWSHAEASNDHC